MEFNRAYQPCPPGGPSCPPLTGLRTFCVPPGKVEIPRRVMGAHHHRAILDREVELEAEARQLEE